MGDDGTGTWISSKELLARTGISRATLNNYIALGLLSKPRVKTAQPAPGQAPRLGFFPVDAVAVIARVAELKQQGLTMAQIVELIAGGPAAPHSQQAAPIFPPPLGQPAAEAQGPRLTIDHIDVPAYLVNNNLEVEWCNDAAGGMLLACPGGLPADIRERNVLRLLLDQEVANPAEGLDDLLALHLSIAKHRLSKMALLYDRGEFTNGERQRLDGLYDRVETVTGREILTREVNLAPPGAAEDWHTVYVSFFREGTLYVVRPSEATNETLLDWLARRDVVIRDLLRKRRPCLTPLAVLVADLQDSVKICAELPPEEYFELINDIWSAVEPLLRPHFATHGKHVGDGMVYYFFPQPDANYAANALSCAWEMQKAMAEISRRWRARKNWLNELRLNIGIDEGEEWFGTNQAGNHIEFTVLGDTINRAGRLSDFARNGSLWVTKNLVARLPRVMRQQLRYGIRRQAEGGEQLLIPSTFARISNLIDPAHPKSVKFQDIAQVAVTEVLDLAPG